MASQRHVDFSSYMHTSSLQLVQAQDLKCKKILGAGGFGIVYLAKHRNWDDVAVKYFQKIKQDSIKNFEREVLRMLKTASPQLVEMYGPIETSPTFNFCCIVMEYMEFGSLSSFRRRLKTFPDSVKIHMIYEIALGMNYLHTLDEPIFHRDLKLDNVFVSKMLEAKVGDFGLATCNNATNCRESAGTLTHIPPEKLDKIDTHATAKHDVYSFGITLWELATGQQVFENCQSCLVSHGVQNGQRPDETNIAGNEPLIIKTLMKEAWDQDPAKRPEFKEIKDRIKMEFESNYKQFWDDDCKDVKDQLRSEVSVYKDQSHEETAKFPWENNTVLDSPNTTNTGTPAPLQPADPVPTSDNGAQSNSQIMDPVRTRKPCQDDDLDNFSDMTITSDATPARTADGITTSCDPVTEKIIMNISKRIGKKWMELGRELQLTNADIENIDAEYNVYPQSQKAFQVMYAWMTSHRTSETTKANLAKALKNTGLIKVAEML